MKLNKEYQRKKDLKGIKIQNEETSSSNKE